MAELKHAFISNPDHDSFIRWLSESNREIRSKIIVDRHEDDEEIGVFAAEKYFNEEHDRPKVNEEEASLLMERMSAPKSPSALSDSSCPSQIALAHSFSGAKSDKPVRTRKNRMKILSALCRCSCAGKSSVDVLDSDKAVTRVPKVKILYPRDGEKENFLSRASKETNPKEPPEKATVYLPPIRRETEVSASSGQRASNDDDSDASSDLIEIESLSGKVISYFDRQDSGVGYPPSESSIEWSVATATASAANISVWSESDNRGVTLNSRNVSWKDWCHQSAPKLHSRVNTELRSSDDRLTRISTSQMPPFRLLRVEPSAIGAEGSTEQSLLLQHRNSQGSTWMYI